MAQYMTENINLDLSKYRCFIFSLVHYLRVFRVSDHALVAAPVVLRTIIVTTEIVITMTPNNVLLFNKA
jgi:hypothetical protein